MGSEKRSRSALRMVVAVLAVAAVGTVLAAAAERGAIGQVKTLAGEASLLREGQRSPLKVGDLLREGDAVETGPSGSLGITFTDSTTFALGPGTKVSLDEFRFDSAALQGNLLAGMERGTLSVAAGEMTKVSPDAMKVRTPRAILGVRGTEFLVQASEARQKGKKGEPSRGEEGKAKGKNAPGGAP